MTKSVYDGYRSAFPNAESIRKGWYKPCAVQVPGYTDTLYGGDLIYDDLKA